MSDREIEVHPGVPVWDGDAASTFEAFFRVAEPRLRRALIARFGSDNGREATVDALVYGWRNWDRVRSMANPLGYLYRVGASKAPARSGAVGLHVDVVGSDREPLVEPGLEAALDQLSEAQRVCVVLRYSFEWTYAEIGELLDVSVSSVRNHLDRALRKLRSSLALEVGHE